MNKYLQSRNTEIRHFDGSEENMKQETGLYTYVQRQMKHMSHLSSGDPENRLQTYCLPFIYKKVSLAVSKPTTLLKSAHHTLEFWTISETVTL
jgi:hypothetical protein